MRPPRRQVAREAVGAGTSLSNGTWETAVRLADQIAAAAPALAPPHSLQLLLPPLQQQFQSLQLQLQLLPARLPPLQLPARPPTPLLTATRLASHWLVPNGVLLDLADRQAFASLFRP